MTATIVRYVTFGLAMVYGVVGGLFVIGETFAAPGGAAAAGLVACWLVPLAALVALALVLPDRAVAVLTWVTGAVVVFVLLAGTLLDPRGQAGPIGAITVFALSVALAFLGVRQPRPAGLLMVAAAAGLVVAQLLAAAVHGHHAGIGGSTAAVVVPVLALGGLFLLAGSLEHRTTGPHGGVRARPSAR
jgi:hypothetical protein